MNTVKAFIEGEMADGKSGTLPELIENAKKERKQKEAVDEIAMASVGVVDEMANPLDGVKVEMQPNGIAKNIMDAVIYGKTK